MSDSYHIDASIIESLTDKTLRGTDELKVARVIATMLGVDKAESMSNPEQLVNLGLTKVRSKTLNPESIAIVKRMLDLASVRPISGYVPRPRLRRREST